MLLNYNAVEQFPSTSNIVAAAMKHLHKQTPDTTLTQTCRHR